MPYLKIESNVTLDRAEERRLLGKVSATVAEQLGKPEQYVMAVIETGRPMLFAGSDEPLAFLELKSIGLPESHTADLSNVLCKLLTDELDIPQNRIYIEFANAPRAMWGWNGGTF